MTSYYFFEATAGLVKVSRGVSTPVEGCRGSYIAGCAVGAALYLLGADTRSVYNAKGEKLFEVAAGYSCNSVQAHNNKVFLTATSEAQNPAIFVFDPLVRSSGEALERVELTSTTTPPPLRGEISALAILERQFVVVINSTALFIAERGTGAATPVDDERLVGRRGLVLSGSAKQEATVEADGEGKFFVDEHGVVRPSADAAKGLTASCAWRRAGPKNAVSVPTAWDGSAFTPIPTSANEKNLNTMFWFPESVAEPLEQCDICFDGFEDDAPAITLDCGHGFHVDCLTGCVDRAEAYRPKGQRIVFNMARCPSGCGSLIRHHVFPRSAAIAARYAAVLADTKKRAEAEYPGVKASDALEKYLHYVCYKCSMPFWGGNKDCAAMMTEPEADPKTLLCEACNDDFCCPSHQRQFVVYKCEHCCRPATHLSFGRRRICDQCLTEKVTVAKECCGPAGGCPLPRGHAVGSSYPVGCLQCLEPSAFDLSKVQPFTPPTASTA